MKIADAHNDLLMNFHSLESVQKYVDFCKTNEVVKLFAAFYVGLEQEKGEVDVLLSEILHHFSLCKGLDLLVPTFENLGFVKNQEVLEEIVKLKPFCATLTWNGENCLAGGVYSDGKFTDWGRKVARTLIKNGIKIDTAHLNRESFWQFAEEFEGPIFCSHVASAEVYSIPRNFDKEQFREIGRRNGYVGLAIYNKLMTDGVADFDKIRAHLDNILEHAGPDCVGLGTDFCGDFKQNPHGIHDYLGMQDLFEYFLTYYSGDILQKVFNKNLLNFMNR